MKLSLSSVTFKSAYCKTGGFDFPFPLPTAMTDPPKLSDFGQANGTLLMYLLNSTGDGSLINAISL